MAIRKRGNSYQIDYFDPNGKRVRKSFRKRKDAEAELGKRVSLMAEGRYLDIRKDYTTTLGELLDRYVENYRDQASYRTMKHFALTRFKDHFGEGIKLANIRYVDLETYKNHYRRQTTKSGSIRATATINRDIACLRHLFSKAIEWEMLEKNPFDTGKTLLAKENNKRFRYLTEDEIERLLSSCVNDHTRDITEAVINTGMRRKEILSLKWEQIRGEFIYLSETKTSESRQIPVNEDLAELLKGIRKRRQLKSEYIFCDKQGRPFREIKTSFKAALRRAGIEDFRFHDLRHTFASHFIMRGGEIKALMELLGHKSLTMTTRYAHLSQCHKKKAIDLLNGLTRPKTTCHKTVTFRKSSKEEGK